MQTVREIMTRSIVTIGPEATIAEAIDLLLARRVSGLPVVDADGCLVGIITEFALLALAYDENLSNQTVGEHMTNSVITVDADDPVSKVADLCIVHRVRRLPVLEGRQLAGLVSRIDVIASIQAETPVAV